MQCVQGFLNRQSARYEGHVLACWEGDGQYIGDGGKEGGAVCSRSFPEPSSGHVVAICHVGGRSTRIQRSGCHPIVPHEPHGKSCQHFLTADECLGITNSGTCSRSCMRYDTDHVHQYTNQHITPTQTRTHKDARTQSVQKVSVHLLTPGTNMACHVCICVP